MNIIVTLVHNAYKQFSREAKYNTGGGGGGGGVRCYWAVSLIVKFSTSSLGKV